MAQVEARTAARSTDGIIDSARYPLHDPAGANAQKLVSRCRKDLVGTGSFKLTGFLPGATVARCIAELEPLMAQRSYRHTQVHNVYFDGDDSELPPGHGALARLTSANRTLTCDQLNGTIIRQVYEWDPLLGFLAAVLERRLYRMRDPLARLNVMGYGAGDALDWHFDRSQFTVTLLLQAPEAGGIFQYRRHLRSDTDANYAGVARLLAGQDPEVRSLEPEPGTLSVFAGRYSAHRITRVEGTRMRLIAVLSFVEAADVEFTAEDRARFYGRSV